MWGLPPGAEVDRGTLTELIDKGGAGLDAFEVAPDRVTFYLWPQAGDAKFSFAFRARYPMRAKTAASALYDYCNPEARVVVAPATMTVR